MNRARSQAGGYAIAMLVACSAPAVVAEETVSFDPQHNPQTQQLADELAEQGVPNAWLEQALAQASYRQEVLDAMKESGHFEGIDLDSLSTTIVGFLRGSSSCLLGVCSYARGKGKRNNVRPGERAWRILVNQQLIHQTNGQLEATIYHEYLHAILGSEENHGPTFQAYEALWPFDEGE